MAEPVKVTCRNCQTVAINDEEFCPKCHFRLRSARFNGKNPSNGNKTSPINNPNLIKTNKPESEPVKQKKEEFKISDFQGKSPAEIKIVVRGIMFIAFSLNKDGKYTESRAEIKKAKDIVNQVKDSQFRRQMLLEIENSFNETQKFLDAQRDIEQLLQNTIIFTVF